MQSIFEYLQRNTFENKVHNIIFDLDEDSLSLLDEDFVNQINENKIFSVDRLITEEKYYDKTHKHKSRGNRTIWTSNDGDELKIANALGFEIEEVKEEIKKSEAKAKKTKKK